LIDTLGFESNDNMIRLFTLLSLHSEHKYTRHFELTVGMHIARSSAAIYSKRFYAKARISSY